MADPFSIAAGALGVAEVAGIAIKFLVQTQRGTKNIDKDLDTLIGDIASLQGLCEQVGQAFNRDVAEHSKVPKKDQDAASKLWQDISVTLEDSETVLLTLRHLVEKISGDPDSPQLLRYFRKRAKDDELQQIWQRLNLKRGILQAQLTSIHILITRQSQVDQSQSFNDLSLEMTKLVDELKDQVSSLQMQAISTPHTPNETGEVLATAASVQKLASLNVYFDIPRSVDSLFTGREQHMTELRDALAESEAVPGTKKFVIHGLGGSGKTQFCCKFAQECRQQFWGVFSIDASNAATVLSSYRNIAVMAGREASERNVKLWLSEQSKPWLLIVDNADEYIPEYPPDSFFPESDSGIVLLTTRNHSLRTLGNVGPGFLEFKGLEQQSSTTLLLRSAGQRLPLQAKAMQLAESICTKLGYLPLAISQAGTAIRKGRCTLETCLTFLEKCWTLVRETIQRGDGKTSKGESFTSDEAAYTTFEMVCTAAEEDAKDLLRLFSFMHSQRVGYQVLLQAITNPQRQREADKESSRAAKPSFVPRRSAQKMLRNLVHQVYGSLERLGDRPAMPRVIRSLGTVDPAHADHELRKRLTELTDLALIDHVVTGDSYCMHPLVHYWTRSSMTFREKAVWCQAACNVLSLAILLPPVGSMESDAELRRQALPHVVSVQAHGDKLQDELRVKQKQRSWSWPPVAPKLGRSDILQYAKFSLVYAECGLFEEAKELLLKVDGFLVRTVGLDHPIAIKARLFLSETYWWLTDGDKAARLQQQLLETCRPSLGDEHADTLVVIDRLGASMWQLGRYHEAEHLAREAVSGFRKQFPEGDRLTYKALTNLGRSIGKLAKFDKAVTYHSQALGGLLKMEGVSKSDALVLEVKENFAMARLDRYRYGTPHHDDLRAAKELQNEVFCQREDKLGKEHPLSLWAACNLARIKAADGQLVEAEDMMRERLPIAERTIGPSHMGTLFGKTYFAHILILAGNLVEAETMLFDVYKQHQVRTGEKKVGSHQKMHGDQLVTAAFLLDCYRRQQKDREAEDLEQVVLEGTRDIFGPGSAWEDYFVSRYSMELSASAS